MSVLLSACSGSIMLRKLIFAVLTFFALIIMSQASPIAENTESNDNDMRALLTTILALLPPDQLSLNQYINNVIKMCGMRLPCTIHSIVPWEFNCTLVK